MPRKIDSLYCSRETASDQIRRITQEITQKASQARHEVSSAIAERIEALQAREAQLLHSIDEMRMSKSLVLEKQLVHIENGVYPSAQPEDPDQRADPNVFLLDADAEIAFRIGENDFLPSIADFGRIDDESTYASKSYAKGPALGIMKMHNLSSLLIFTCNRSGIRRKEGGDRVSCQVSSLQDFEPLQVEDLKDGRYRVQFMPRQAGNYTLNVAVGSEDNPEVISGSPFQLIVRAPTNYRMLGGAPGAEEPQGKKCFGEAHQHPWEQASGSTGSVHHPAGIDFDHTGRYVFVADQSSHRIQVFDTQQGHEVVCSFGNRGFGVQEMDTPHAVVADRDNRVVVSDVLNHRLQVLEFLPRLRQFRHAFSVGGSGAGEGQFQFPKGLAITENGLLLVCDYGNHRVQVFDMAAGFRYVREFGSMGSEDGQFTSPLDVAINCAGEFLVSDMNHRIQVFDAQGKFLRAFGCRGRKDGELNYPISLATNDENALFVCDQGNHRMQVFDAATGSFIHKWGGSKKKKAEEEAEDEEGKPPEWLGLRSPAGVAVNADGSVMVTDYKLNAVFAF